MLVLPAPELGRRFVKRFAELRRVTNTDDLHSPLRYLVVQQVWIGSHRKAMQFSPRQLETCTGVFCQELCNNFHSLNNGPRGCWIIPRDIVVNGLQLGARSKCKDRAYQRYLSKNAFISAAGTNSPRRASSSPLSRSAQSSSVRSSSHSFAASICSNMSTTSRCRSSGQVLTRSRMAAICSFVMLFF